MSADLSAPAFRATVATRDWNGGVPIGGTFTLDVFATGTPPAEPARFSIEPSPEVACDPAGAGFGGGLYPWAADYAVTSNAAAVEAALPGALLRLSGPNGRGGTFTLWTKPLPGERERSAAPRVYGTDRLSLPTYDGIAGLSEIGVGPFLPFAAYAVAHTAQVALPGGGTRVGDGDPFQSHVSWPIVAGANPAAGPTARALSQVRFPGGADLRAFLRQLAEVGGLAVYQPSDAPPGLPRWEAVPRSALGTAEAVARIYYDADVSTAAPGTLPNRTVGLPPFEATPGGATTLPALGSVAVVGAAERAYEQRTLGEGETFDVVLGHFEALPGLRIQAVASYPGAVAGAPVQVRHTPVGGTPSALPVAVTASGETYTYTTEADLPSDGRITLRLTGQTVLGEGLQFGAGAVRAVGPDGATLDRFTASVSPPGPEAEIARPLAALNAAGNPSPAWSSRTTGLTYDGIEQASAATRASQQATDLWLLDVTMQGLWGPESRFTLAAGPGADGRVRSPFPDDVELVVVGCEPDILAGTTRATLCAARVDDVSGITLGARGLTPPAA